MLNAWYTYILRNTVRYLLIICIVIIRHALDRKIIEYRALNIRIEYNIEYLVSDRISEKAVFFNWISDIFRISNRIPEK